MTAATPIGRPRNDTRDPSRISSQQLADIVGLTDGRINQMVQAGQLTRTDAGFDPLEALRDFVAYYRSLTGHSALKAEKLQKEIELAGLKIQKEKGEAILKVSVDAAWADIILRIRDKFRRIGAKISPRLPFCKSELEMQKIIEIEIDEALTELSRPPDYNEQTTPAQDEKG